MGKLHHLPFFFSTEEMILPHGLLHGLPPRDKVLISIFAFLCEPGKLLLF